MLPRRVKPETKCDRCERAAECYKEGRLIGYWTLDDPEVYAEYGRNAHVVKKIGVFCPTGFCEGCWGCEHECYDEEDQCAYCKAHEWKLIENDELEDRPEWCPYKAK